MEAIEIGFRSKGSDMMSLPTSRPDAPRPPSTHGTRPGASAREHVGWEVSTGGLLAGTLFEASHQPVEVGQLPRAAGLAAGGGPVAGNSHGGDQQAAGAGGERSADLVVEEGEAGGTVAESM